MGKRDRGTVLQNTSNPSAAAHKKGPHQTGTSPGGARGWCPTLGTQGPERQAPRDKPLEHLAWKTNGADVQGPKVLQETKISLLEGLPAVSFTLRPAEKTAVGKAPSTTHKQEGYHRRGSPP